MNNMLMCRVWDKVDNAYWSEKTIRANAEWLLFPNDNIENVIVERSTGLKDKNGNLIYENDVVEITIFGSVGANGGYVDSDEIYKGTVVWDRDCFLVKTDADTILFPHSEDCIEIIGNIHETKDK